LIISDTKLSTKQLRFVDVYSGNGTEAARQAGYTGSNKVLGITASRLLANPSIADAIKGRESTEIRPKIVSRQERQEFWTQIMLDETMSVRDRLRASELLGKSEADFTDKHELQTRTTLEDLLTASLVDESVPTSPPQPTKIIY
jgi:phage terminase small subunit